MKDLTSQLSSTRFDPYQATSVFGGIIMESRVVYFVGGILNISIHVIIKYVKKGETFNETNACEVITCISL